MILSVTDCGLGLTTLSQANLLKLDRVQNEAMRVIFGTIRCVLSETMQCLLDLLPVETGHKGGASQSVPQWCAESQKSSPRCCQEGKGACSSKRQVMDGLGSKVNQLCVFSHQTQASKGLGKCPDKFKSNYETLLPENHGRHCREWPLGNPM